MMAAGRQTFRFDTFGDEAFWGDTLQLHLAIEGENFGGVGPGLSPNAALSLGLKIDVGMLSPRIINQLRHNQLDLNDPAVTLLLLRQNAVVGLAGSFNQDGSLRSIGISCSLCHSAVDNSLTFGIGHRLGDLAVVAYEHDLGRCHVRVKQVDRRLGIEGTILQDDEIPCLAIEKEGRRRGPLNAKR